MISPDKLKILYLSKLYPSEFNSLKGVFNEVMLYGILKYIPSISVTVVRPVAYGENIAIRDKKIIFHHSKIEKDKFNIYYPLHLSYGKYLINWHHYFYYKRVKKLIISNNIQFDLIHAHWLYPDGYVAVKIGKYFKKPVVVHCHGGDININIELESLRELNDYTIQNADALICVSNPLKEKLIKAFSGCDYNKIKVIHNSINIDKYSGQDNKQFPHKEKVLSFKGKKIVFVGKLTREKGIYDLLEAARIIKKQLEFQLYLIGEVTRSAYQNINKIIADNNLQENVFVLGPVPHDEIKSWFNVSDLSVLPSHTEGLPMVILESFACGTPVVATNVGGIPEALYSEEMGILISPNKPGELAKALVEALGKNYSKEKIISLLSPFGQETQVQKITSLYKEVLSN